MPALLNHKRLCMEIKNQELKQEALSEQLGISDRHLRNLCSKDTNVSTALLYRLSEVLQVPMGDLLTILGEEPE